MHLTKRLAVAAAAAALAGPLLSTPAAHAAGSYDCFGGTLTPTQTGYDLTANGCAGGGYVDVVIRVRVSPAAGTHRCGWIFTWHGDLSGHNCRPE